MQIAIIVNVKDPSVVRSSLVRLLTQELTVDDLIYVYLPQNEHFSISVGEAVSQVMLIKHHRKFSWRHSVEMARMAMSYDPADYKFICGITDSVTKSDLYELEMLSEKTPVLHLFGVDTDIHLPGAVRCSLGDLQKAITSQLFVGKEENVEES